MNTVWCKAWPDVIHDFRRFDVIPGLQQDIVRLAHNVGLEEVDGDNVGELLGSHNEKLAKEYLMELLEQPCTASDLAEFNYKSQQCAQLWLNHI